MDRIFTRSLVSFLLIYLCTITASSAQTVTISSFDAGPYGQGSTIGVPFKLDNTSGCLNTNNVFRLYLSDASGSFASQTLIGSFNGFYASFVNGIIPAGTPAGSGYRVRIVTTNPSTTSAASAPFNINGSTGVTAGMRSQSIDSSFPEVFGSCVGADNNQFSFINTSTAGATVTAGFFNEIAQSAAGERAIPGTFNAGLANYTVTVKAVAGGVVGTKSYMLINNTVFRNLGGTGDNTYCLNGTNPTTFNVTIDDTRGSGIRYNFPGLIYRVNWGDGTSQDYKYCELFSSNGTINHNYIRSSCGRTVDGQRNVFKVDITPVNPYCNSTVTPSSAYAKILSPPKNNFTLPEAACVNTQIRIINDSEPGQDPNSTSSDCANLDARYTWIVDGTPVETNYRHDQPLLYTFTTTGIHTVTLHLQNSNALCETTDRTQEICIQQPPRPAFTLSVTSGCAPLNVNTTNTSFIDANCNASNTTRWVVSGPSPVGYAGGTNATSTQPQFVFSTTGVYKVKLTINTASCGRIETTEQTVYVDSPPVATLSADQTICGVGQTFTFNEDDGPTKSIISGSAQELPGSFNWTVTSTGRYEFVAPTTASSRYPQIRFLDEAVYTIRVVNRNACGAPATDEQVLTVRQSPIVSAGDPANVCADASVALSASVNGSVNRVQWTSPTGGTFSLPTSLNTRYTPSAADAAAGSVLLTFTAFTNLPAPCDQVSSTVRITVDPVNAISSDNTKAVCSNTNLNYAITASQAGSTFTWRVDPARTSANVSGYAASGSGNIINDVLVNSDPANASVITYLITAAGGTCNQQNFVLTVNVAPANGSASFTADRRDGCGDLSVQFTNTSVPLIGARFVWDFGDGSATSTDVNPVHTFAASTDGTDKVYNVTLTATTDCGVTQSLPVTITVRPQTPVASIIPDAVSLCSPYVLTVNNTSPGENRSYTYYLYDGSDLVDSKVSTTKDPVNFTINTTQTRRYTLYMVAEGLCGTTGESIHIPITISSPLFQAAFFPSSTNPAGSVNSGCNPFSVNLTNISTAGADKYYYNITNSDGTFNDRLDTGPGSIPYSFPGPGIYYITLTATNNCGINTSPAQRFDVYGVPQPDFTADVTNGCRKLVVTFTNNTPPQPDAQAASFSYDWDFGDGSHSSAYNPGPHEYSFSNSPFTVTLTATNTVTGCSNIISKSQYITVTPPPGALFTVRPDTLTTLPNYTFSFEDQTTGTPVLWSWSFGDGQTATNRNPNHTYADTGRYLVTLRVIDRAGCDSTYKHYVRITGVPGQLFMPNAFMPAGSSAELRAFTPKGSGLASYRIQIYNKWGELVWESNKLDSKGAPTEGWDGNYKGMPAPQGVYIWQATATYINGSEWKGMSYKGSLPKRSGVINLIR